ncbi:hypothetical protein BH23GEM4_BH23GEM4_01360 [soil metagenome]
MRLERYLRDLLTFPADAAFGWRNEGWRGVWREVRERTLVRVYRRTRFYLIDQDLHAVNDVPPPAGVVIEPFEGEWERLAPVATRRQRDRFRRIAGADRVCLVAWRGSEPIGYTWYSLRIEPRVETYDLPLPADATYGWGLYVPPAERGGGIGSALVTARLRHARERGFRRSWRIVAVRNAAALRTVEKAVGSGSRVLGEVDFLKLGGRHRTHFRPRDPSQGLTTGAAG